MRLPLWVPIVPRLLGHGYLWLVFFLVCAIAAILPLVVLTYWLGI